MRWKRPRKYDTRVIKRFLLLPRKLRGEVRWLEWACIEQEYNANSRKVNRHGWLDTWWRDDIAAKEREEGHEQTETGVSGR